MNYVYLRGKHVIGQETVPGSHRTTVSFHPELSCRPGVEMTSEYVVSATRMKARIVNQTHATEQFHNAWRLNAKYSVRLLSHAAFAKLFILSRELVLIQGSLTHSYSLDMRRPAKVQGHTHETFQSLAERAYVFGYPLVLMEITKRIQTAVAFPVPQGAPLNQFAHTRALGAAHEKGGLRPHADSLDSVGWLDLAKEPIVLTIPKTDRYFLLDLWSVWYDIFEVLSSRTIGDGGGHFALTGPRWSGKLSERLKRIPCPTETVWVNGRFQAAQVEDIQAVHQLQDQLRLTPLSEWGKPATVRTTPFRTNIDRKTVPREQISGFTAKAFYTQLARLMWKNPPQEDDAPMIEEMSSIGLSATKDFAFETLPEAAMGSMQAGLESARQKLIDTDKQNSPRLVNGWSIHIHPGRYGTDYLGRALSAFQGAATSLADDIFCLHTTVDQVAEPLRGSNQYTIHFDQDRLPPVNASWTIALYDGKHQPATNAVQRYAIGDHDRLRVSSDGSLTIYIQHDWPGFERDSNWLPAPKGGFELLFHLYWPKPEVLRAKWRPPAVIRVY